MGYREFWGIDTPLSLFILFPQSEISNFCKTVYGISNEKGRCFQYYAFAHKRCRTMTVYSPLYTRVVCTYNSDEELGSSEELEEELDGDVVSPSIPQNDDADTLDTGVEEEEAQ